MASKKIDSPYRKYSIEQITQVEAGHYVIQVGDDFFSHNGKVGFSLQRAETFYLDIMSGLMDIQKNGSDLEKEDATKCLLLLKMYPLRFH